MRRDLHNDGDQRYRSGFVIEHNPEARKGAGSCIFAHLWKAPGAPTAGCTEMADATMARLYGWLRPEAEPVFVLLPPAEYDRLQRPWHLPQCGRAGERGSPLAANHADCAFVLAGRGPVGDRGSEGR